MTSAAMQDEKSMMEQINKSNQINQTQQGVEAINQLSDENIHKLLTTASGRIFQHAHHYARQM